MSESAAFVQTVSTLFWERDAEGRAVLRIVFERCADERDIRKMLTGGVPKTAINYILAIHEGRDV